MISRNGCSSMACTESVYVEPNNQISQTISIKFEICKKRHMIEMKKKENGLQPVQANDNQYP